MRMMFRKAGVACGAAFASVALALSGPGPAMASNSALVVGGIDASSLHDLILKELLGGALRGQDRVSVNWPAEAAPYTGRNDLTLGASINVGKTNLNAQIDAAMDRLAKDANGNYINGEKVTVVGLSAGSLVVNEVLRQLAAEADAPDKDQITFVLVADSSRQKLIDKARYNSKYDYTYQPAPETEYDIVVVTGEYDGMADFPDRWWNGLAVMNAIAGGIFVHVPMMFADLSKVPAENIDVTVNSKGGTTTNYLVPTAKLPLVQMFPFLAKKEAELKAKIDKGYSRNDVRASAARAMLTSSVVDEDGAAEAVTDDDTAEAKTPVEDTQGAEDVKTEVPAEDVTGDGGQGAVDEVVADSDAPAEEPAEEPAEAPAEDDVDQQDGSADEDSVDDEAGASPDEDEAVDTDADSSAEAGNDDDDDRDSSDSKDSASTDSSKDSGSSGSSESSE